MSDHRISDRPVPVADELTQPFWEAAARHELCLQGCPDCNRLRHPPTTRCPACGSTAVAEWKVVNAPLRLLGWTTVHVYVLPGSPPPFVVGQAGVDGEDAVALVAQIRPAENEPLRSGTELAVDFIDLQSPAGELYTLLAFKPKASR